MVQNENIDNVESFRKAMTEKDAYTMGHSDRVSEYSALIGKKLGLSEKEIDTLKLGGLFHDIGKMNIPDEILKKESKLTDDEYIKIKNHTEEGTNMVSNSANFKDIMPIIEYHHEKYNGTGYNNLKGEEIPYLARITSVADSFDAMTSNRAYRQALPIDVAKSELEKGAGTQFDPAITKEFLNILENDYEEIKKIQEKYK